MNDIPTPITSPHYKTTNLPKVPELLPLPQARYTSAALLKDLDCRDKSIKIVQYVIKILLYYNVASSKRWSNLTTQLSVTRQILCLGNALPGINSLTRTEKKKQWLVYIQIMNAVADDVYCLHRLGVVSKRLAFYSQWISSYCWFISLLAGLRTNYTVVYKKGQDLTLAKVNVAKSIADLLFCGCDILQPSYGKGLQAWTGLASGVLSGYKIYQRIQ
ncbi:hypothetical protein MFLAVUS_011145 [Mucor flavus]|uniref:Peroxisomal membrane protein 11C n=1 Tax=Mucor flavus TaxID=439312 RepID=A0ABP9ZEP5_9FUNG